MAGVWALADSDLSTSLTRVFAEEQALAAQRLALVREIDGRGLPSREGATSTVAWLRDTLRISVRSARQMVELAKALDTSLSTTGQALADGVLNEEQALVIARAVTGLAGHADAEVQSKAEDFLVEKAATFEPVTLATLGRRVLDTVAPELADEQLAKDLKAADERAARDRTFTLSPDGTGRVRLTGWLETEAAAIVTAALDPLCAPGKLAPADPANDDRLAGQRRADALTEICRYALAGGELPDNGGDRPQIVVTMNFDDLATATGAGMLDTGGMLAPEAVRRLACDAALLPAVLGGQGQVLDVGRERRLFTGPLRRALLLRDGGCAFPGCDRPPRWCDGHHVKHWADGGATCLDNAVLACGYHHRLLHRGDWQVRMATDGLPEFVPPTYIDRHQTPRRNTYHRRP